MTPAVAYIPGVLGVRRTPIQYVYTKTISPTEYNVT